MKFSFYSVTWLGSLVLFALVGCAETPRPAPSSLQQRSSTRQTASSVASPNASGNTGGAITRTDTLPVSPVPQGVPNNLAQSTKIKAGILLPLTGKNAALGQAMFNAAQQAVFDAAGNSFELQPHDTAAEGGAEEAARAAVAQGVSMIIGPLFATDIPLVMPIAQRSGIQMLALSTDTTLAQPGLYIMGLAPAAQVSRIVNYVAAHGSHGFAALVPSSPYGALVEQVFKTAVSEQQSATLVDVETYGSIAELDSKVRSLASQKDRIDALFLPEGGSDLKLISDQLAAAGFDQTHVHVLGTGLWDVPGLGKLSPFLIGAWYAAPDPAIRRNFVSSYAAAYGQEPPRLATLAYDATALAAVIAKKGVRYDQAALTNPNGFAGLDGIFRLLPSGEVERALAVNQVTPDGARLMDAAPTSFMAPR